VEEGLIYFLLWSGMTLVASDTSEIDGGWSAGDGYMIQVAGWTEHTQIMTRAL